MLGDNKLSSIPKIRVKIKLLCTTYATFAKLNGCGGLKLPSGDYRKLVLVSPGFIHLRKGLRRAQKKRSL